MTLSLVREKMAKAAWTVHRTRGRLSGQNNPPDRGTSALAWKQNPEGHPRKQWRP